jgi:hypothetical protein|nr:MAG TPA: Helicase REPLICATION [Caudoviricetes sp.]
MKFKEFVQDLNKKAKKGQEVIEETTSQLQFPTGFIYLDYICGNYIIPETDEGPICQYHNIGILAGSVNMIIAKSQGGKTTIAAEMAAGIMEPWLSKESIKRYLPKEGNEHFDFEPSPLIQYIDSEKTMTADYLKKILCMKNSTMKNSIVINQIDTEKDLYHVLEQHIEFKKKYMSKVAFPMRDVYNEQVVMYPPTVAIIDSITQLEMSSVDGMDDDALKAQMQNTAGAQRAKAVSQIYRQLVIQAKKYNIIMFCINHINKAPQMSFLPQPKQFHGLKQDETIAGGERPLYLATNILRLDRVKQIGQEKSSWLDLGDGVTGFIVKAAFIKNKSNSRGNQCFLVYTNRRGYCPILSTLYTMKENEELQKVGNFYVLDDLPSIKFTFKNVLDVFAEHPEMIGALYEQCKRKLEPLLDNKSFGEIVAADKKKSQAILDDDSDGLELGSLSSLLA